MYARAEPRQWGRAQRGGEMAESKFPALHRRRGCGLAALGLAAALAMPAAALGAPRPPAPPHHGGPPSHAATPIPDVSGPIPITSASHPFTVGGTDLAEN